MIFRKSMARGTRLLVAAIFVIGMTATASVATQQSALALTSCATPGVTWYSFGAEVGNYPTYNFTPHVTCSGLNATYTSICQSQGSANECTEIYVDTNHDGNYADVYAVGVFSCNNGSYIRCSRMQVSAELGYRFQGNGNWSFTPNNRIYSCSGTSCPSSGPADVASAHVQLSGTAAPTNDCWEVYPILPSTETIGGYTFSGVGGWGVNICVRDQIS